MKRILSVLVAAILLCTALVGCGGKSNDSTTAKVKVTVEADDVKIIENVEVEIEGIDGNAPLAIDAIIAALDDNDIKYELKKLGNYDMFDVIDEYGTENNDYIWELYIDDAEEPAEGRFATIEVADGNTLLLKRNAGVKETATDETTTEATTEPPKTVETVDDGFEE
ncbi:MAG: hypothetical protein E7578_00735 [Ruminococcaceae bacterium]|nr:hypothetical protein [Oscillospiraceae bacterium]